MRFYLTFGFLGFKVVKKWTVNLFKGSDLISKQDGIEVIQTDLISKQDGIEVIVKGFQTIFFLRGRW